jgi:SPOR domain
MIVDFLPRLVIRYPVYSILIVLLNFSCAVQKSTTATYEEDLSPNRPKFQLASDTSKRAITPDPVQTASVKPVHNVNDKVDPVLDSIDRFNLTKRYVDGFTIQVYSGQKREDAMNTKQKIMEDTPELIASLQYVQPKFRVTVGHYFTKLEGQQDLTHLKRYFTAAILVPEKILIK